MNGAVNDENTDRLLGQKLGDLVRWMIEHLKLRIKPHSFPLLESFDIRNTEEMTINEIIESSS